MKQAQAILAHIERLVACGIDGSAPPEATAHWRAACSEDRRAKLATLGLAPEAAKRDVVTVGGLVERYHARPKFKNLKPAKQRCVAQALMHLLSHFDPTTSIDKITAADANDFYGKLRRTKGEGGRGLAVATSNLTPRS